MGINGLVEQVIGFDVPIPLAVARIAAVVCAEIEHMVSGRARFVAGEFVLGEHAVVVEMGIDAVGQRGIQVEAEPCGRNAGRVLVGLCDEGTLVVAIPPCRAGMAGFSDGLVHSRRKRRCGSAVSV